DECRLAGNSSRPAHWIEQRIICTPSTRQDHRRGQRLAQRRLGNFLPVATAMEQITRCVSAYLAHIVHYPHHEALRLVSRVAVGERFPRRLCIWFFITAFVGRRCDLEVSAGRTYAGGGVQL